MLRLGYACVNTLLPSASRTARLVNASPARLLELSAANLDALTAILRWNVGRGIEVFRVSSGTIPFGGHPANDLSWEEELLPRFDVLAGLVRVHELQLSTHPGQFVVFGARDERLVAAAVADVEYHARLLRALGLDTTHGIVIHLGGVYDDRAAAAARLERAVERLSDDARARLRLEHDERWSLDQVLQVAGRLALPVVFDRFHHRLNPSLPSVSVRELVERAAAYWPGPQEVHFSTQDPGRRRGAHAEALDLAAFERFAADVDGLDLDCMLEVKDKEQSLLKARGLALH